VNEMKQNWNKNWVIKLFKLWWFDDRYCWSLQDDANDAPIFQRIMKKAFRENRELFEQLAKL
jgi:hypothetical protein